MLRLLFLTLLLALPLAASAQRAGHDHGHGAAMSQPAGMPAGDGPREPGQAAFAAIQEIVAILVADPTTDWSKVNIEALRRHLIDMDNVTLRAAVVATPVDGGMRYDVTGDGAVRDAIRRMVKAHARTVSGTDGMTMLAEDAPEGAVMKVTVEDPAALPRLKALGFIGLMTLGMHHQEHHLMIASGRGPHE
jgi:hypothetical protein